MPKINIDSNLDSSIAAITVIRDNESFFLQIDCRSVDIAKDLQGTLGALKMMYEIDSDPQNFTLHKFSQQLPTLKISGNIFNALNILREKEVINRAIFQILDANTEIESIIQSSKPHVPSNPSIIGFFNSESLVRKDIPLSPNESRAVQELEDKISHLSDNARETLIRDLYEKYKSSAFDKSSPKQISAKN